MSWSLRCCGSWSLAVAAGVPATTPSAFSSAAGTAAGLTSAVLVLVTRLGAHLRLVKGSSAFSLFSLASSSMARSISTMFLSRLRSLM
uniref:Putative secreted protein n=1 Tax=Ixodes ricinus TaxID=34613 RepID=A0A6B0UFT3_IXORI